MAIVYEHLRNDNNEVFYVGIGEKEERAYSNKGRQNPHWHNIVNKVGYSVNIIHKDIDWEEACKFEKHLIFLFGRKDLGLGNLVNLTNGGEGTLGAIHSKETKNKIGEASKGRTHTKESKQKISEANKGNTPPNKGVAMSDEQKEKISKANKGKIILEETRQKLRGVNKGNTPPNKGVAMSDEQKEKISKAHRNRKGVKGYYFNKKKNKFISEMKIKNIYKYLGSFDTPQEAAEAYQKAKLIYHI